MMLSEELEDWFIENGVAVVEKHSNGILLSSQEQLLYEVWLLYIETSNGGLSQYFCNEGLDRWRLCIATASGGGLTSFAPFAQCVDALIAGANDPYLALVNAGERPDRIYYEHETAIVTELRALCSPSSRV